MAIAEQMEYREHINREQQQQWFNEICNSKTAFYFIMYVADKPVGLIHLNQIAIESGSAHAGLFIGDQRFIGTGVVLGASLLLLHFAFDELELETVYAKVKNVNKAAIAYNQLLGFERVLKHNHEFDIYALSKAKYELKQKSLEKLAATGEKAMGT